MTSGQKELFTGLDVGKLIAAVLIIILHTHPLAPVKNADYWLTGFCRIAVPFFFITSSFLFFFNNGDIRRYITRILILYAVWFVIEAPLTYYRFFILPDRTLPFKVLLFLRGLFINSTFYASWYLTASWQAMLIVWWLSKKIGRFGLWAIGILCFVSALPGTMWYGLIAGTPARNHYWLYNMMFCPANSFIIAIPYCILGRELANHRFRPSKKWTQRLLVFAILFSAFELWICRSSYWMTDVFLGLLFICPLLVRLLTDTSFGLAYKYSKCIRSVSTLLYLCHLPIKFFLSSLLGVADGVLMATGTLLISFLFSISIYYLSLRVHWLRFLY